MTQRNRTAVRVNPVIVVSNAKFAQDSKPLRGESLIEFDDVHCIDGKPEPCQKFLCCGRWASR